MIVRLRQSRPALFRERLKFPEPIVCLRLKNSEIPAFQIKFSSAILIMYSSIIPFLTKRTLGNAYISPFIDQKFLNFSRPLMRFNSSNNIPKGEVGKKEESRGPLASESLDYSKNPGVSDQRFASSFPQTVQTRTARIYQPSKSVAQHVPSARHWCIQFPRGDLGDSQVWREPLMGWQATQDPMWNQLENKVQNFRSLEAAIEYCKRNGFSYVVDDSNHEREVSKPPKNYAQQFTYIPEGEDW